MPEVSENLELHDADESDEDALWLEAGKRHMLDSYDEADEIYDELWLRGFPCTLFTNTDCSLPAATCWAAPRPASARRLWLRCSTRGYSPPRMARRASPTAARARSRRSTSLPRPSA